MLAFCLYSSTDSTAEADMDRKFVIVSTEWLADRLAGKKDKDINFRVLDATWHLPSLTKRKPREDFYKDHIPGALFFDIDECRKPHPDLEHLLPSAEQFAEYVGKKLGIGNEDHVVIYDNNPNIGIFSAPRVWWLFKVFGHDKVSVLSGGFEKWNNEEVREVTDELIKVVPFDYQATLHPEMVKTFKDVENNLETKEFQLLDARPAGRFNGTAPEPRPDTKPGHIPGAVNIPFTKIVDQNTKLLKTPASLNAMLNYHKVEQDRPMVVMCGSGVTSCCLLMAAYVSGRDDIALYDGSWTEWYKTAKWNQMMLRRP
ncbi:3-mercaptopyruvate sulfurtransferase-like [Tubulanus polymorphus]|uniref:3-mercaptopyruvate sulfurtransferase-like n=1 Tax=Tubulanus polymorphus TaxID=672921 RepID=UPI003DA4E674